MKIILKVDAQTDTKKYLRKVEYDVSESEFNQMAMFFDPCRMKCAGLDCTTARTVRQSFLDNGGKNF